MPTDSLTFSCKRKGCVFLRYTEKQYKMATAGSSDESLTRKVAKHQGHAVILTLNEFMSN